MSYYYIYRNEGVQMNLDIIFCKASRCEVKDTCGRCLDRFKEWSEKMPKDYFIRPISVGEFGNINGTIQKEPCDRWFKREEL